LPEQLESSEVARKAEIARLEKDLAAAESRAKEAEASLAAANRDLIESRLSNDDMSGRYAHESKRSKQLEIAAREARQQREEAANRVSELERDLALAQSALAQAKERLEGRVRELEGLLEKERCEREQERLTLASGAAGGPNGNAEVQAGSDEHENATPEQLRNLVQ
jgi:chromosome segregation ATPase